MLKNVTVTVEEEDLRWARREAAEKSLSVSKLLGQMIARERRAEESHGMALERWKQIKPWPIRASERWSRNEAHERRR